MDVPLTKPKSQTFNLESLLRSETARRLLALSALVILFVFFSLREPVSFTQPRNHIGIGVATAINGLLALGVTFVIITGGIDLSLGSVMAFSAVMTGQIITNWDMPVWVGVIGGILTGTLAGLVNGVIISWMRVPPFVTTLGMMYVARGAALLIANIKPIYFPDNPEFKDLAMGNTLGLTYRGADIPNLVWVLLVAALLGSFILSKTILGRYTFAMGSNEESTRLSGIKTNFWKTAVYAVCGFYSGLAGVMIASRLNSAQPAEGAGYELDAIAAVVIGGTSLAGGEGSIFGTIIGAFVMGVLVNGLRIMGIAQEWQIVVTGTVLVLVVFIDILRRHQG